MANGTRIIVKLRPDVVSIPYQDSAQSELAGPSAEAWDQVVSSFPDVELSIDRLLTTQDDAQVQDLMQSALGQSGEQPPDLLGLRVINVGGQVNVQAFLETINALHFVEYAYEETPLIPAAINPSDDPLVPLQAYLLPAPFGVDAFFAWSLPGGDGANVRFLDVERGWNLNHEDLVGAGVVTLNSSVPGNELHSTACLGIVLAQDNVLGVVGIAPKAQAAIASSLQPTLADAFVLAAGFLQTGDVLLIEEQTVTQQPVEMDPHLAMLIRTLALMGIVVIEPAGNGAFDLNTLLRADGTSLDRTTFNFFDSLAIVAGARQAASSSRASFSCFGNRVDCHAWGEGIVTTSSVVGPLGSYMGMNPALGDPGFGGTSGASAIIAGVAVTLQGIARARGTTLIPDAMRTLMSGSFNTPSPDPIGVMPNLREAVNHF